MAVDPAGNVSPEAKVSIQIEKPDTKVTYADMEGNPAHKASIRLAEEGIFVGSYVNGSYFFDPDQPVSLSLIHIWCKFVNPFLKISPDPILYS